MGRPPLKIDVAKKGSVGTAKAPEQWGATGPVVLRALALLQLAAEASAPQIARVIPLTPQAIRRLGHRYRQAGRGGALYEKQRPGAAEVLDASNSGSSRWCAVILQRAALAGRFAWWPRKP